ncbi:MAG: type IX secretion system membrane protein PorP/SprF [Bacteroidales bacterium]
MKRQFLFLLFFYFFAFYCTRAQNIHALELPTFDIERLVPSYQIDEDYAWHLLSYGERQWAGFEGAPTLAGVSAFYTHKKMGFALHCGYEQMGFIRSVSSKASVVYKVFLSHFHPAFLQFSLGLGIESLFTRASNVITEYPIASDLLTSNKGVSPIVDISSTFKIQSFTLGAAFTYIFGLHENSLDYVRQTSMYRVFTFAEYDFELSRNWTLTPLLCYSYREGKDFGHTLDVGLSVKHTFFGFKIMDRTNAYLSFGLDITAISHLSIGYTYTMPLCSTQSISLFSSHAVSLKFGFGKIAWPTVKKTKYNTFSTY